MQTKTVSVIVPVFNEEKTVARVVKTLLNSELISEVICVNDGSTDKTLEILRRFGPRIRVINLKRNHGKGFAMVAGIRKAKGEIVAFFDGDLINLSSGHIKNLLEPVLAGTAKVAIGTDVLRKKIPSRYPKWAFYFQGTRAYYKEALLPHLLRMAETGYGVETYLNSLFKDKDEKVVPLAGLTHVSKEKKWKLAFAFKQHLVTGKEIGKELGKKEIISPQDYQKIRDIFKAKVFAELESTIREIKSDDLRKFFEHYILRYLKITWRELKKPIEFQDVIFGKNRDKQK